MNGPNKLEYYIIQGCKNLPVTNTVTYWANWQVAKEMKCCEYGPRSCDQNPSFSLKSMNGFNKLVC